MQALCIHLCLSSNVFASSVYVWTSCCYTIDTHIWCCLRMYVFVCFFSSLILNYLSRGRSSARYNRWLFKCIYRTYNKTKIWKKILVFRKINSFSECLNKICLRKKYWKIHLISQFFIFEIWFTERSHRLHCWLMLFYRELFKCHICLCSVPFFISF